MDREAVLSLKAILKIGIPLCIFAYAFISSLKNKNKGELAEKVFDLAFYVKWYLALFILIPIAVAIFVIFINSFDIISVALSIFLLAFGVYELLVFLAINGDPFKDITIDDTNARFLLTAKNNQVLAIPFENVEGLYMTKGEVLRGISCGHITIQTKDNKVYGLTISDITSFAVSAPKDIKQNMEEKIFYLPRWNKVGK